METPKTINKIKDDKKEVNPIFLLSLPRSGSTLLQRILATHPNLLTVSEPWLALPVIYGYLNKTEIFAEYQQNLAQRATNDYIKNHLNNKPEKLNEAIKDFLMKLYEGAIEQSIIENTNKNANNETDIKFFLDKTPRYHLIANELAMIFPNAKFIILWRNPLATAASMLETLQKGKWALFRYKIDLYDGVKNLLSFEKIHSSRVLSIQYEKLVNDPENQLKSISNFLQLAGETKQLNYTELTQLVGSMGDNTGVKQYKALSQESLGKWKNTFYNPIRKSWATSYINHWSSTQIEQMGYKKNELLNEVNAIPFGTKNLIDDFVRTLKYRFRLYKSMHKHGHEKLFH